MTPTKKPVENIEGKGENAGLPAFSPFPTIFCYLPKANFKFSVAFIRLSANALDQSKNFVVWLRIKQQRLVPSFDFLGKVTPFW